VYNYIGLGLNFEIRGNGIRWNETKHVELEQFLHAFTSRGFHSVSWAFLYWSQIIFAKVIHTHADNIHVAHLAKSPVVAVQCSQFLPISFRLWAGFARLGCCQHKFTMQNKQTRQNFQSKQSDFFHSIRAALWYLSTNISRTFVQYHLFSISAVGLAKSPGVLYKETFQGCWVTQTRHLTITIEAVDDAKSCLPHLSYQIWHHNIEQQSK